MQKKKHLIIISVAIVDFCLIQNLGLLIFSYIINIHKLKTFFIFVSGIIFNMRDKYRKGIFSITELN